MYHTSVYKTIEECINSNKLIVHGQRVFVGFSGGADSTYLLLVLSELCSDVQAVHLHHGLRDREADQDADWCRDFCAHRAIPCEVYSLQVPDRQKQQESVEEAARRCRREFWDACAPASSNYVVALGHHADDCLEELFLRLARGSNASGLTGLRLERIVGKTRYIRPLLNVRSRDIREDLFQQGITDWCEDRTNTDTHLRRNLVRHKWLPLLRETWGTDKGFFQAEEALHKDADFIEQEAQKYISIFNAPDKAASLHPALFARVMRLWLQECLGRDFIPNHETLERTRRELHERNSAEERRVPLGDGVMLRIDSTGLYVDEGVTTITERRWDWTNASRLPLPEINAELQATILPVRQIQASDCHVVGHRKECFALERVPSPLIVRNWQTGDAIVPFGSESPRKLQDVFVDVKVPRFRRPATPLLTKPDGHIIWIVGVKRAETGRIDWGNDEWAVCFELIE